MTLGQAIDVLKLSIPIRMLLAFQSLGIGLEAVTQMLQQLGNNGVTDDVALLSQRLRQLPRALARPTQWRFRMATRDGRNEFFQSSVQGRILVAQPFSTSTDLACTARLQRWLIQFLQGFVDGGSRQARCRCDQGDAAITEHARLSGRQQASLSFVQVRHKVIPFALEFEESIHANASQLCQTDAEKTLRQGSPPLP